MIKHLNIGSISTVLAFTGTLALAVMGFAAPSGAVEQVNPNSTSARKPRAQSRRPARHVSGL